MKSRRSAQVVPRGIGIGCGRLRGLRGSSVPGSGPRARGTGLASPSSPRMLTGLGSAPAPLLRTGTCSSAFDDGIFQAGGKKKKESPYPREHRGGGEDPTTKIQFAPHGSVQGPVCSGGPDGACLCELWQWFSTGKAQSFLRANGYGGRFCPLFRCLVWWHEQGASFGLNCVLCWADRGEIDWAHHFFPGHILWATRAYGFRRLPSMEFPIFGSPRRRPSDLKRPDHILRNTRFTKAPPQQQPRWDDTWHTWRHRRDPACRNDHRHHPNSRTRRRAAVAGWTREVTAESGTHTLRPRQVGRVWSRVPDLTDGSRNLSLSSCLATTGRPAASQASWCGTVVVPRCPVARRFQRSWRPKAHSSMAPETPPAPCRMPDTGPDRQLAVPSPAPPRSVRARFGWRSRTPESPMAIPTQVPDRETGRRGEGRQGHRTTAVQTPSDHPVSKITPDESRL